MSIHRSSELENIFIENVGHHTRESMPSWMYVEYLEKEIEQNNKRERKEIDQSLLDKIDVLDAWAKYWGNNDLLEAWYEVRKRVTGEV